MILFGIYLLLLFRLTIVLQHYVYVAWNVRLTGFCFIKFLQLEDNVFSQVFNLFFCDFVVHLLRLVVVSSWYDDWFFIVLLWYLLVCELFK